MGIESREPTAFTAHQNVYFVSDAGRDEADSVAREPLGNVVRGELTNRPRVLAESDATVFDCSGHRYRWGLVETVLPRWLWSVSSTEQGRPSRFASGAVNLSRLLRTPD